MPPWATKVSAHVSTGGRQLFHEPTVEWSWRTSVIAAERLKYLTHFLVGAAAAALVLVEVRVLGLLASQLVVNCRWNPLHDLASHLHSEASDVVGDVDTSHRKPNVECLVDDSWVLERLIDAPQILLDHGLLRLHAALIVRAVFRVEKGQKDLSEHVDGLLHLHEAA